MDSRNVDAGPCEELDGWGVVAEVGKPVVRERVECTGADVGRMTDPPVFA